MHEAILPGRSDVGFVSLDDPLSIIFFDSWCSTVMFFWGCTWETRVVSPPFLLSHVLEISSFALLAPATQAKGKLPCLIVYRALKVSSISVLSTDKRKLKPYRFPRFYGTISTKWTLLFFILKHPSSYYYHNNYNITTQLSHIKCEKLKKKVQGQLEQKNYHVNAIVHCKMKRAKSTPKAKSAPISRGPIWNMLGRFGQKESKQF